MWVYNILILLLLFLTIIIIYGGNSSIVKKTYLLIAFIPLFILSAFRSENIGNDTKEYLRVFDLVKQLDFFDFNDMTRYERGYIFYNKLIALFTVNNQFLLIISSAIVLISILIFIYKHSTNVWLSVYLFITLRFYYFSMTTLREYIAIAITLFGYEYLIRRKFISFLVSVLLAFSFHLSAIIFLLLYPLSFLKFNKKNVYLILLAGIIVYSIFDSVILFTFKLFPQYQQYSDSAYFDTEGKYGIILIAIISVCVMFVVFFTKYYKSEQKIKIEKALTKTFNTVVEIDQVQLFSFIILLSCVFNIIAIKANLIERMQEYFSIFYIVVVPNALSSIKDKNLKILLIIIIMSFAFLYQTLVFIYRPEWNIMFPYEFYWQK